METNRELWDNYEAPGVESVVSPEELEREVLYAGTITQEA